MKSKKIIIYILALVLASAVVLFSGCNKNDVNNGQNTTIVETEDTNDAVEKTSDNKDDTEVTIQSDADDETEVTDDDLDVTGYDGSAEDETIPPLEDQIPEDGEYTTLEQVSTYLHLYGHLPGNYLTKDEAKKLGWNASEGNLWEVAPGSSIGGDSFGNREGNLPSKKGRKYYECDVNYEGGNRGAERIVYSNDGLIYYTDDHYETFTLFFGEE